MMKLNNNNFSFLYNYMKLHECPEHVTPESPFAWQTLATQDEQTDKGAWPGVP